MVDALLIGVPLAGWLVVFTASLGGRRLGRPRRGRRWRPLGMAGPPSPGVIGLLAGRPDRDSFAATLLDLSARGWFGLADAGQARPARERRTPDPLVATMTPEPPAEQLGAFEQRAVGHLARRAGAQRTFPADALLDGFAGGDHEFMRKFRGELIADSRARGLSRPTLSPRRKVTLCLLALIPAGGALLTMLRYPPHGGQLWVACAFAFYYGILFGIVAKVSSERLTEAGEDTLGGLGEPLPAGLPALGTREGAYAVALGRAAVPLTAAGNDAAWSGFGDQWRLVPIGSSTERMWPGITAWAFFRSIWLILPGLPMIFVLSWVLAGAAVAKLAVLGTVVADAALFARAYNRWAHLPRFAEFDGLVVRQWEISNGEDGTDYYVAVDDGASARAWAFKVASHQLATGTIVHVHVNPRLNKLLSIEPVRQLPVAPLLAETVDPSAPGGS
jgi:hypothetical protein